MKRFFSKGLLLFVMAIMMAGLTACSDGEQPGKTNDTSGEASDKQAENKKQEPKKEQSREDVIRLAVEKMIKEDFHNVKVNKIQINENLGLDDESYIVLPHLVFDVKNTKKTTREMVSMYSEHLAAKLADEEDISEVTVFWEVPYHKEGNNAAKFNFTRSGSGMAIGEDWFDPVLSE